MNETTEVTVHQGELQTPADQQSSLLNFVAQAVRDPNIDVNKLEALLKMQREIIADEARRQYAQSMNAVQAEMVPVWRDTPNTQTNSRYAKLESIDLALRPVYSRHGFSLSYDEEPTGNPALRRITCEVTHVAGHAKMYHLDAPLDTTGAKGSVNKTDLHGLGSTVSYLRRYLLCMIFNVTLTSDDDDGNAGSKRATTTNRQQDDRPPPPKKQTAGQWLAELADELKAAPTPEARAAIVAGEKVQQALKVFTDKSLAKLREVIAVPPVEQSTSKPASTFDAALVDQWGEIIGEPYTDPVAFARALVELHRKASTGHEAIREHNADAIEDARQTPEAAAILTGLDEPPTDDTAAVGQNVEPIPPVVGPEIARGGAPHWASYVRALKADVVKVPREHMLPWIGQHRDWLAQCPAGQRVPAIRALSDAIFAATGHRPGWLADLMQAKTAPSNEAAKSDTPLADAKVDPRSADEKWIDDLPRGLADIPDVAHFDNYVRSAAIQQRMRRLKREAPALFDRADAAFGERHAALKGAV